MARSRDDGDMQMCLPAPSSRSTYLLMCYRGRVREGQQVICGPWEHAQTSNLRRIFSLLPSHHQAQRPVLALPANTLKPRPVLLRCAVALCCCAVLLRCAVALCCCAVLPCTVLLPAVLPCTVLLPAVLPCALCCAHLLAPIDELECHLRAGMVRQPAQTKQVSVSSKK